jgi:hypothetical protein
VGASVPKPGVTKAEREWLENMARTEEIAEFRPGLYRHYKGGLYTALALVTHHEKRMPMVLYVSHTYGGANVRPLIGWIGDPDGWNDFVTSEDGHNVRRFTLVGELPSDTPIAVRA